MIYKRISDPDRTQTYNLLIRSNYVTSGKLNAIFVDVEGLLHIKYNLSEVLATKK